MSARAWPLILVLVVIAGAGIGFALGRSGRATAHEASVVGEAETKRAFAKAYSQSYRRARGPAYASGVAAGRRAGARRGAADGSRQAVTATSAPGTTGTVPVAPTPQQSPSQGGSPGHGTPSVDSPAGKRIIQQDPGCQSPPPPPDYHGPVQCNNP